MPATPLQLIITIGVILLLTFLIIGLTWFTFPAATTLRTMTAQTPERWLKHALGPQSTTRSLGEAYEASATISGIPVTLTWNDGMTELIARGQPSDPAKLESELPKGGTLVIGRDTRWRSPHPPGPQLRQSVEAVIRAIVD